MVVIFKKNVIKKLIPEVFDKAIFKKIDGKYFVFDKESLKEFDRFKHRLFNIFIMNGYLARYTKCNVDKITFFHEWLMREKVENFREENDDWKKGNVHIHHITFCKRINIKRYLKVTTKKQHYDFLHAGYRGVRFLENEDSNDKNEIMG